MNTTKLELYEEFKDDLLNCQKCDLGNNEVNGHNPHVVGQGNVDADVMFIAEAPGEQETIYERPLTPPGTSGKLYEKVLQHLGLTRDDVYTTNTVACRPPKNRDPEAWEIKKCRGHLERQISLVQPKLIVTFGRFAAQVFINGIKITKDHGKISKSASYDINVFPMFHPAYVQAYAPIKQRKAFQEDIKKLKKIIYMLQERAE